MIRIFIETKNNPDKETNEKQFFTHLTDLICENTKQIQITGTDGYTNLHQYVEQMQRNTEVGGKNLVIFDADAPVNGGGYEARLKYLAEEKTKLGIDFDIFLLPNNKEDGMFEHLLEHLTVEPHKQLLSCFDKFQNCVTSHNHKDRYTIPAQKAKIYTYIGTIKKTQPEEKKFKNGDWFFDRSDLWNFEDEYLQPLKEFLSKHIND